MFTPETWLILSKKITDNWAALEETLHLQITSGLVEGIEKGTDEWYKNQINKIPDLQKLLAKQISTYAKTINKETFDAIKRALSLANTETLKAVEEMTGTTILDKKVGKEVLARSITKMFDWNNQHYNILYNEASRQNGQLINKIKFETDLVNKGIKVQFNMREATKTLFDTIKRQTEEGISNGFRIAYSNGTTRSFKSYQEMNVRTTVQHIALDMMEEACRRLMLPLFLASEHADCADDHVEWQGKVYLADWATDKWNGKYKRIGVAKQAGFTTRPNCRHYFVPITNAQAENLEQTKKDLKTVKGVYREKNYKDLVKQRYNERQIKKYKARSQNSQALLEGAPDEETRARLLSDIAKDEALVRGWQKRQRMLIASNSNLKRDYRRESNDKIVQDLGVKIQNKNKLVDNIDRGKYTIVDELKTREYNDVKDKQEFIKNNGFGKDNLYEKLPHKQITDLKTYTNREHSIFKEVNSAMRNNDSLTSEQQRFKESLANSLSQFELKEDIVTYRGVSVPYERLDRLYFPGQILKAEQFTSTSIDKDVAELYSEGITLIEYKIPKGFNKGMYLEGISETKEDEEFLISYDADFFVENIMRKEGKTTITMIALPKKGGRLHDDS